MPTTTHLPFAGPRLREKHKELGLSQAELAERCAELGRPVSQGQISRLEADRNTPFTDVLDVLARALDIPVDALTSRNAA